MQRVLTPAATVTMFTSIGAHELAFIRNAGAVMGGVFGVLQMGVWLSYAQPWTLPVCRAAPLAHVASHGVRVLHHTHTLHVVTTKGVRPARRRDNQLAGDALHLQAPPTLTHV